ncbi:MAG: hypothetical protein GX595_08220 [Lentisphaerae bacterium]|nr:hypothetical protein [Lentisphaerota bacterium]
MELLRSDRNAFCLLYLVAVRARWNQAAPNWHSLALGEALVGDHNALGMSREQYRAALGRLVRYGMVTTIRTTSKGTVVKLCSKDIFDPTRDADNHQNPQLTPTQPPPNPHLTPTKKTSECKKVRRKEEDTPRPPEGGEVLPFGEDFRKAWEEWKTHLREKRKTLTPTTARKQLKKLAALTEAEAIATIDYSIGSGYPVLYLDRSSPGKPSRLPAPAETYNITMQEV